MANRKPDHDLSGQKSNRGLAYLRVKKESTTDQAIAALRQLESDIRYLQEKSEVSEGELRNRDIRIEQLMSDLDSRDTQIQRMEVDIDSAKIQVLQEELDRLHVELADKQELVGQNLSRNEELQTENADLWRKVQDLEMFIEGRQDEWAEMNNRLLEYQNRLAGMEQQIESREAAACTQEKEKGDLAIRILELEGRCTEHEDARALLQKTLDRRSEQVAQLNAEVGRMECELNDINSKSSEEDDPFNVELLDFPPPGEEDDSADDSSQCEQFDLLEADSPDDWDMSDVFGLCEDSIIDIGIAEEPEGKLERPGNLKIFPMPARQVLLAIYPGADESRQFLLSKAETTIGRSRHSDICIPSKYISREHARIIREDTRTIIEDVGSTNGFLINSEEKQRHRLQHGDRIKIGTEEFEFLDLPACK